MVTGKEFRVNLGKNFGVSFLVLFLCKKNYFKNVFVLLQTPRYVAPFSMQSNQPNTVVIPPPR